MTKSEGTKSGLQTMQLQIKGRVQGVGYRWFARDAAQRLGLAGYVQNLPDGSVELLAQGPRQNLDALVIECKRGPSGSRVTDIASGWPEPSGSLTGFEIRK